MDSSFETSLNRSPDNSPDLGMARNAEIKLRGGLDDEAMQHSIDHITYFLESPSLEKLEALEPLKNYEDLLANYGPTYYRRAMTASDTSQIEKFNAIVKRFNTFLAQTKNITKIRKDFDAQPILGKLEQYHDELDVLFSQKIE